MIKNKIYIDLTNLMAINFMTGIQRVAVSVVTRMLKRSDIEIVLLSFDQRKADFNIIDNSKFLECFEEKSILRTECLTRKCIGLDRLEAGAVFFDIDGVWSSNLTRSYLYPILKNCGLSIVTMVYDIIPITHPQFCYKYTIMKFISYLGAVFQYCDKIITNTNATVKAIKEVCKKMDERCPECEVVYLGSDFKKSEDDKREITYHEDEDGNTVPDDECLDLIPSPDVSDIIAAGKYILMVGTIEPRKNHSLVIDALDNGLQINVVFAGKKGWNVDELFERIKNHPLYEKRLFLITNANDAAINELYKNAYYLAFPTFNEGFGLPMIESFAKGTPVIASDIEVLKEVSGDFADYFDNTDPKALVSFINESIKNPALYEAKKERLKDFVPYTWDMTEQDIYNIFTRSFEFKGTVEDVEIKQMVVLTARHEDIMKSLPFIEHYMPFIKELVVCCPEWNVQPFKESYKGKLKLTFRTDDELLNGRPLPEDHVARNFFLRCMAMKLDCLDDVFIMTDDDYRPLCPISKDVYISNGRYVGYYFYDMKKWGGTYGNYTSFDLGAFKTRDFLIENNMPTMQYASHMPQVIDKRIFCEILDKFKSIENEAYEEWDIYFNYLMKYHPDKITSRPYISICWPGATTDWELYTSPGPFMFENYYSDLYENNGIFAGFSREFNPETADTENREKMRIWNDAVRKQFEERKVFESYCRVYNNNCGWYPSYMIHLNEKSGKLDLHLPGFIEFQSDCCIRIPITITKDVWEKYKGKTLKVGYHFFNIRQLAVLSSIDTEIMSGDTHVMLPVRTPRSRTKGGAMVFYAKIEEPQTEQQIENEEEPIVIDKIIRKIPVVLS